jgi:hypothetical protein
LGREGRDAGRLAYDVEMKEIAPGRIGLVAAKYGEQAPMATVCCNACRTCMTTNLLGVVLLTVTSVAATARRLVRRQPDQQDRILGTDPGDGLGVPQGPSGKLKEQVEVSREGA